LADNYGNLIGSINRNFRGFGREIFTDTGQYVLRMDAASPETTNISNSTAIQRFPERQIEEVKITKKDLGSTDLSLTETQLQLVKRGIPVTQLIERTGVNGLTLDERAVMLATAVSIDFDYFSHTSGYHLFSHH
jgi:Scramblase